MTGARIHLRGWGATLTIGILRSTLRLFRCMPYRWTHSTDAGRHEWLFKRNCALSPLQLAVWFSSLGVVSTVVGIFFAWQGAWLVLPFTAIEVAALAAAFFWYGRHAADFERLVADNGRLIVETGSGPRVERIERRPSWIRVEYGGRLHDMVELVSGRERIAIGRFVPSDRRGSLAGEIRSVLAGLAADENASLRRVDNA